MENIYIYLLAKNIEKAIEKLKMQEKKYEILKNNNIGFIYKEAIDSTELEKLKEDYFVFSDEKMFAISKVIEMNSIEQNRVALYLFNSINFKTIIR